MDTRIDMDRAQRIIALATEKIAEEDPDLLDKYRRLFKKEVSLFHRSKVAACMLMLLGQGRGAPLLEREGARGGRRRGAAGREGDGGNGPRGAAGGEPQRYPLADEDSKWLFFGVGRSRRVSPREILSAINMRTALPKEDIGAIRILENYSFVQVRDAAAERIIAALDGHFMKGRPLTVNYARSSKGAGAEGETGAPGRDGPGGETPGLGDGSAGPGRGDDVPQDDGV